MIATKGNANVGDRVRFKTFGGWWNSGIVKEIDGDSCLVEVDSVDPKQKGDFSVPYLVRLPFSKWLKKCQEMEWISIKDEKPPDGERVILCMKKFGWNGEEDYPIFASTYHGGESITHWMPLPEPPEKSPNYEIVDYDTSEIKEVDPNNKREWEKKGADEMTIGELCNLVDNPEPSEHCQEVLIFMSEDGTPECKINTNSPFLKKFFWDKKFKSVSAEGVKQFGIWGLED